MTRTWTFAPPFIYIYVRAHMNNICTDAVLVFKKGSEKKGLELFSSAIREVSGKQRFRSFVCSTS